MTNASIRHLALIRLQQLMQEEDDPTLALRAAKLLLDATAGDAEAIPDDLSDTADASPTPAMFARAANSASPAASSIPAPAKTVAAASAAPTTAPAPRPAAAPIAKAPALVAHRPAPAPLDPVAQTRAALAAKAEQLRTNPSPTVARRLRRELAKLEQKASRVQAQPVHQ